MTGYHDTTGGFHEEGGIRIIIANGQRPAPALPQLENGATRYVKNGYYVIKDQARKILSFGKAM